MKRTAFFLLAIGLMAVGCKDDEPVKDPIPTEPEPEWVTYNTGNSKLTNDQVNALAVDKNDVKWVGTAEGLVKIKGNDWTAFKPENSALPSVYITSLAAEENGTIWVGTDKGVARYDGTTWTKYTTEDGVLTNNGITAIAHDPKQKITWIGTDDGLIKVKDGKWERIDVGDNTILSLAVDQKSAVWVGIFKLFSFKGQINKYENGQWTRNDLHTMGYPSAFPYSLAVDKHNAVLGVLSGTSVKCVLRISSSNFQEIPRPEKANGLKTILVEGDKIWVGGNSLSVFGDAKADVIKLPHEDAHIQTMAMDSKGKKWLGTMSGGLVVYNAKNTISN